MNGLVLFFFRRIIYILVFFIFIFSTDFLGADQKLEKKDQGILVLSIFGRGCIRSQDSQSVFVLSEDEFKKYSPDQTLNKVGLTPLRYSDMSPGIYYVAVDVVLDTSIIPMKIHKSGYDKIPDYNSFFIYDGSQSELKVIFTGVFGPDGSLGRLYILRKWYKIIVENNLITTVSVLFLDKSYAIEDLEVLYPKKIQFNITSPIDEFWQRLEKPITKFDQGIKTTLEQRKILTRLLKKGGRIAIPETDKPIVIWIDNKGSIKFDLLIAK